MYVSNDFASITLSDCCTCSSNHTAVQTAMEHFNKTCKTFAAVNAFKYQLQHYLFHDANNATLPEGAVQNLTTIIIGLQAMANHLQDVAITEVKYRYINYYMPYYRLN